MGRPQIAATTVNQSGIQPVNIGHKQIVFKDIGHLLSVWRNIGMFNILEPPPPGMVSQTPDRCTAIFRPGLITPCLEEDNLLFLRVRLERASENKKRHAEQTRERLPGHLF